jgi:hypothetical protein
MPFLLNEDKALKSLMQSITVSDAKNSARAVGVWFGQPDVEIRDQSYPYVTLDLIDISEDPSRVHRGVVTMPYTPEGLDSSVKHQTEFPIPVNIDYQVTSYARQPLHDRQIISNILNTKLPFRFGTLEIPEDNTLRRVELLGYAKRDRTEQGKRLFVNMFTIRVSAELFPSAIIALNKPVSAVNIGTIVALNSNVTPPS